MNYPLFLGAIRESLLHFKVFIIVNLDTTDSYWSLPQIISGAGMTSCVTLFIYHSRASGEPVLETENR